MIRNTEMGRFSGGVWNMVFVGAKGAPKTHCGNKGGAPITAVDQTPLIAEKAYLVSSGSGFSLMVPKVEHNKAGIT